jgi:glycogen debranching enzyme
MFASVMRHGLIPNLHDQGNNTRFNARDASWFFMEALQAYVEHDRSNGASIWQEKLEMQFLDWDQQEHYRQLAAGKKKHMAFCDIVQTIMQAHVFGIDYVEWNAGTRIDAHMVQGGFQTKVTWEAKTGFIYGGNRQNCGTWMDKLGSSDKARNRGVPATPRDGADVELIGLLRSALRFLTKSHERGEYPYESVNLPNNGPPLTFKEWVRLPAQPF